MRGDDIAERFLRFAAQILGVTVSIRPTLEGRLVRGQLSRCGTSGGANYEEARGAESRADFAHKVLIAAKETREAVWWLRLIAMVGLSAHPAIPALAREGNELVAILMASARTARDRA